MNTTRKQIADCQNRLWLAAMNGKPTTDLYKELDSLIARLNEPGNEPEPQITLTINER